jgi:hypothetical protein
MVGTAIAMQSVKPILRFERKVLMTSWVNTWFLEVNRIAAQQPGDNSNKSLNDER